MSTNETRTWIPVGLLDESDCDFSKYRTCVGIYRASIDGRVVYVGKAIEATNGGLQKRLRDYTRTSDSARRSKTGVLMNEHKSKIKIEIMVFAPEDIAEALAEEQRQIQELEPDWNIHGNRKRR